MDSWRMQKQTHGLIELFKMFKALSRVGIEDMLGQVHFCTTP